MAGVKPTGSSGWGEYEAQPFGTITACLARILGSRFSFSGEGPPLEVQTGKDSVEVATYLTGAAGATEKGPGSDRQAATVTPNPSKNSFVSSPSPPWVTSDTWGRMFLHGELLHGHK